MAASTGAVTFAPTAIEPQPIEIGQDNLKTQLVSCISDLEKDRSAKPNRMPFCPWWDQFSFQGLCGFQQGKQTNQSCVSPTDLFPGAYLWAGSKTGESRISPQKIKTRWVLSVGSDKLPKNDKIFVNQWANGERKNWKNIHFWLSSVLGDREEFSPIFRSRKSIVMFSTGQEGFGINEHLASRKEDRANVLYI